MMRLSTFTDWITIGTQGESFDSFGHLSPNGARSTTRIPARVEQMSASKSMMVYQQADIVGVEIWFGTLTSDFNIIEWEGHRIHFSQPDKADKWGRITHIVGYYQIDNAR